MPPTAEPPAKPSTGLPSWTDEAIVSNFTAPPAPDPAPPAAPTDPPAAPVAAPKPGDDPETWPRSAKDWDARKAKQKERLTAVEKERDAIKAERDAIKAEIDKAKASGPSPELDQLRKQLDETTKTRDALDNQLKVVDLANHPKFKEYYANGIKSQIDRAKAIVGTDNADRIEKVLSLPDSDYRTEQLDAIASDLSPIKSGTLAAIVARIGDLSSERDSELAKARENAGRIQAEREGQAVARQKQTEDMVSTTIAEIRASDEFKGVLDDSEANLVKSITLGGTKDPKDTVKIIARGFVFPKVLKALAERDVKIKTLEAQITAFTKAEPGAAHGAPSAPTATAPTGATKDPIDRMMNAFKEKAMP